MPKREAFTSNLKCPKCGVVGQVTWSENENPVYGGGLNRKLESISQDFEITNQKDFSGDPQIICSDCKTNIPN